MVHGNETNRMITKTNLNIQTFGAEKISLATHR